LTQCGDIRDALLRGQLPQDAGARAHLEQCPACAALAKSAGPLRAALSAKENAPIDVDALFAGVKTRIDVEDRGLRGYLRSRPTWLRIAIGLVAIALVVGPVLWLRPRGDMDEYPRGRMLLTILSMSVSLVITMAVALRPAYRPPLSRALIGAIAGVVLLMIFLLSSIPVPGFAHPEQALMEHLPQAMPCFYFGVLFGAPVYLLVRALDHEVTRLAALLAASTAGLTANLVLHLHCPNTHPQHILLGHFSVAVVFLALVAGGTLMIDRWRTKSARAR
jgi:hypothetical protein